MAFKYTEEQLHTIDKSILIQMLLQSQEQVSTLTDEVHALNEKMQLIMEQLVLANRNRFGRSSEKMADAEQICFQEVDGNIVFFNDVYSDRIEHSARRFRADLPPFQSNLSALLSTPFRKSSAYLSGYECNDRFSIPPESLFRAL